MNEAFEKIKEAIIDFDTDTALQTIDDAIAKEQLGPAEILKAISDALAVVGDLYEKHEYFMAELTLAGETAKDCIAKLDPLISSGKISTIATVIFGTVYGDIHDIGKTIVSSFLSGAGFRVVDIGVEANADKFVKAIKENNAKIVAISALLSNTITYMPNVINKIKEAGIRDKVKIIVGGRPVTEDYSKQIGADATATNPYEAVQICKQWMGV